MVQVFSNRKKEEDDEPLEQWFLTSTVSFLISDNLQIMPNKGLLHIVNVLGITGIDYAELSNVTLGYAEVMDLLNASLVSSTPLSDVVLKKPSRINSPMRKFGFTGNAPTNSKKLNLKLIVQKSTNKLVCAEAEQDFVEFLFGLLVIPLGEVESLLSSNSGVVAIDNLHKTVADLDDEYFKDSEAKDRLMKHTIPHGYICKSNVLPLTEECLPDSYGNISWKSSLKFPEGQGNYLVRPQTFRVEDDLTVTPFYVSSVLSSLKKMKIPMSDVEEVQLQIGLEEGLRILKASLTSTSALTDALLIDRVAKKQPKKEPRA